MSKKAKTKCQRKGKRPAKRKGQRKASVPHESRRKHHKVARSVTRPRKAATARQKSQSKKHRARPDRRLEIAVREMNRGRSLSATARDLGLSPKSLQSQLKRQRLISRKGKRWVTKDNRLRRVPVMSGGRFRVLTVRGYKQASLVGKHHHAVGKFVRTNAFELIKPFEGQSVTAASGRQHALETDPNALHRIAALDSPPFHEIYEIVSPT
jgi:AraC-like DNA-binding protein